MQRKVTRISEISISEFLETYQDDLSITNIRENGGMERTITEPATNRPGLVFSGFIDYFAHTRVQVLGNSEIFYTKQLSDDVIHERIKAICAFQVPCMFIARNETMPEAFYAACEACNIPLITTNLKTTDTINRVTLALETAFAKRTTAHGCMLHYRGLGILIRGKSGVGKSETAIGLIERGAALVADDHVIITNLSGTLLATTEDYARGFIEMRGIGIINVADIYGQGSILPETKLDLIVNLRPTDDLNLVDRVGLQRKTETVLDLEIPYVDIPVASGRDTARLVSVAALDQQLRRLGYDMADEFNSRIKEKLEAQRLANLEKS